MRTISLVLGALLVVTPVTVRANGAYDWLVGTWSCTNELAAPIGGPANQTLAVAPSVGGSLAMKMTGSGFERSGYIAYSPSSKTWWNPFSYPTGDYAAESTTQTGATSVWSGSYFQASTGKTFHVRDTYVRHGATRFHDVGQYRSNGVWKTGFRGGCVKRS